MADWSLPTVNSDYDDFVDEVKARDVDAITLAESPTTPPTNAIRYNRSLNKFQEWNGATWNDKVIDIAGGGTGGASASAARTALGIGTMGTQDNSSVNITGGTIAGVTMDASVLNTGTVALARGGTGASLALGANGTVMMSNGSAVVFASGANIANLSASNLTSGTVPDARLSSNVVVLSGAQTITGNKTFSGTTAFAAISATTITASSSISCTSITGTGSAGFAGTVTGSGITISGGTLIWSSATLTTTANSGGAAAGVGVETNVAGWITITLNGTARKIAYYAT